MRVIAATLAAFCLSVGCATSSPTPTADADADAAGKAEKDLVACRKMCEMAGATEGNGDAVAECQAKCEAASPSP